MLVVRDAPPGVQVDVAHPTRARWRFDAMGSFVLPRLHLPTIGWHGYGDGVGTITGTGTGTGTDIGTGTTA